MAPPDETVPTLLDSAAELAQVLERWESATEADPIPCLTRLAELVERETEAYLKMDPDPFDDRHPSRARPFCTLGHLLKTLFKNDEFMHKLVNNYVLTHDTSGNHALSTAACRLLLDILPGLETSMVFQDTEGLVSKLMGWAEAYSPLPLGAYATGLLAAAMEVQDVAANFRETNARLVPIMLQRLWKLSEESLGTSVSESHGDHHGTADRVTHCSTSNVALINEGSNSSWAELEPLMIGSHQVHPLTGEMQQRLILQYLTPLGEYQELLGAVLEARTLRLLLRYVDLRLNRDVRLAFEALKYLASLLCHKKFALEFIAVGGLQKLLEVHRPSVASTGVSVCLYYLAYSEDAMERVCLLPPNVLANLVSYAMWLLERSHESSRCNATMFFGLAFPFRPLLELFDAQDGLRKLLNVMSTLDVFVRDTDSNNVTTDEQVFASRQTARHVCVSLKRYFEAQLALKAEQVRRAHARNGSPVPSVSFGNSSGATACPRLSTKAARWTAEALWENIEILLELLPARARWHPAEELVRLGGVNLLLQTVAMAYDWNHSSKADTVRAALDVLAVCSVVPKVQLALCNSISLDLPSSALQGYHRSAAGMSVILASAEGEIVADPDVQRSALNVVINCVCGPTSRLGGSVGRMLSGSVKKKASVRSSEDLLSKMWHAVRANNGIMVLLNLLTVKSPITDADSLRALACKALCGLARCHTVRQIISKLPLFASGQLQVLMREPVLQDKRGEHVKFCRYCMQLVERVTGAPLVAVGIDTSLERIQKSEVVAQTNIRYREKDLLQLIYQHLLSKGLGEAAATLQREASLPTVRQSSLQSCCSGQLPLGGSPWSPSANRIGRPIASRCTSTVPSSPVTNTSSCTSIASSASGLTPTIHAPPTTPVSSHSVHRIVQLRSSSESSQPAPMMQKRNSVSSATGSSLFQPSPVLKRLGAGASLAAVPGPHAASLDAIVKEYLRQQHALCKNPVVTCPPFELFVPHRCPEPQYRTTAPLNISSRLQRSQVFPPSGGCDGAKLHRKFIYSRFRPMRTFRDPEGSSSYSCCAFSTTSQFLFLGTLVGELHVYNLYTGLEEATYSCHESELTNCQPSKDGKLLLTSSAWRRPLSALWTFTDVFEAKLSFDEDQYVEFGKQNMDRILGTKFETAHIYDTATGSLLLKLKDPDLSNHYTRNRATFSPSDDLVLSDGVLWDVRSASSVHKFDKFNANINGVFHPNGLEVISNTEVWDLRSFRLLHTVPTLDQCHVTFNGAGDVLYGAVLTEDDDESSRLFGSSFRTFDASDYSSIATVDIKKNIFDLKTDSSDYFLAIVENPGPRDASMSNSESICRLYEVGRQREDDDDEDAEDDEESEGIEETDDDDDDDDDMDAEDQDGEEDGDEDLDSHSDDGDLDDDDDDDSGSDQVLFALN